MNEDTGPVSVENSKGITPEQYQSLAEKMQFNNFVEYQQKADQLIINLLSEIRDDVSVTRGWVVFMGVIVLLSEIIGLVSLIF